MVNQWDFGTDLSMPWDGKERGQPWLPVSLRHKERKKFAGEGCLFMLVVTAGFIGHRRCSSLRYWNENRASAVFRAVATRFCPLPCWLAAIGESQNVPSMCTCSAAAKKRREGHGLLSRMQERRGKGPTPISLVAVSMAAVGVLREGAKAVAFPWKEET